jgi:alpha-L-fucosidase
MDWHNPDGAACAYDSDARKRFNDFTMGCVRELMTRYGKIDILWYDVARPLSSHEGWDSLRMNQMVRDLQPQILINDRSLLPEDFSTPEESVKAAEAGRGWEACMTFNATSWGWMPSAAQDSHTPRSIVRMLNTACNGGGNLLLNIGPAPDGSVPEEAIDPLRTVGQWLKSNKDAVYGRLDRCEVHNWNCTICGDFSQKGKKLYFWVRNWPGRTVNLGGKFTELKSAKFLAGGKPVRFEQTPGRIILKDLPEECPDNLVGYSVIELTFAKPPVQTYYSETPALTSSD